MKVIESLKTRFVVWVWNHTPNCAEMARLSSWALEQPLPWRLRWRMRLHHVICVWCKRYFEQLQLVHQMAGGFEQKADELPGRGLSIDARNRILHRLKIEPNEMS